MLIKRDRSLGNGFSGQKTVLLMDFYSKNVIFRILNLDFSKKMQMIVPKIQNMRRRWLRLGGLIPLYCLFSSIFSPLYAPPVVVPNLNTPVFNATSMDQTFNVANGMQTVGNWDAFVF
ncbi:TIGR04388 family protein, partial [Leptospira kirschneri]|uniref:TIGR04388 family protein n=1 Tax=Leptospira kirschneri TaxID=29507 RepID=UPI0035699687